MCELTGVRGLNPPCYSWTRCSSNFWPLLASYPQEPHPIIGISALNLRFFGPQTAKLPRPPCSFSATHTHTAQRVTVIESDNMVFYFRRSLQTVMTSRLSYSLSNVSSLPSVRILSRRPVSCDSCLAFTPHCFESLTFLLAYLLRVRRCITRF